MYCDYAAYLFFCHFRPPREIDIARGVCRESDFFHAAARALARIERPFDLIIRSARAAVRHAGVLSDVYQSD